MFRFRAASAVLLLCGLAVAGCSAQVTVGSTTPQISTTNLQQGISDALVQKVGERPDSVVCPSPINAEVGQSERCYLTAGGTKYGLSVTITSYANGKANYSVDVDNQPEN